MSKGFDKIFLQRRYTNVLQVHKRCSKLGKCKSKLPGDTTSNPLGCLPLKPKSNKYYQGCRVKEAW